VPEGELFCVLVECVSRGEDFHEDQIDSVMRGSDREAVVLQRRLAQRSRDIPASPRQRRSATVVRTRRPPATNGAARLVHETRRQPLAPHGWMSAEKRAHKLTGVDSVPLLAPRGAQAGRRKGGRASSSRSTGGVAPVLHRGMAVAVRAAWNGTVDMVAAARRHLRALRMRGSRSTRHIARDSPQRGRRCSYSGVARAPALDFEQALGVRFRLVLHPSTRRGAAQRRRAPCGERILGEDAVSHLAAKKPTARKVRKQRRAAPLSGVQLQRASSLGRHDGFSACDAVF